MVIDFMDASAADHAIAKECIGIIRTHFEIPYVSTATFLVADFVLQNFARNKKWHRQSMQLVFSGFQLVPLLPAFIETVFQSHFTDLEDGPQHECARHVNAHILITKNLKDFFDSKIPVVHPIDFVSGYHELFDL